MNKFNQIQYINNYKKENYKRYTCEVPVEEAKKIDTIKKEKKLSNKDIFLKGIELIKKEDSN